MAVSLKQVIAGDMESETKMSMLTAVLLLLASVTVNVTELFPRSRQEKLV